MKRFLSTIPIQDPEKVCATKYKNLYMNKLFDYRDSTRFPIIPVIFNAAEKGEEINVALIKIDHPNTETNYQAFKSELDKISSELGITVKETIINIPYSEHINDHLDLFGKITGATEDRDKLYLDITYGSKPMPIIILMAATCAYKYREDVSVECIGYGQFNFVTKESCLFDVTSLFYMNRTVNMLDGVADPFEVLDSVLNLDLSDIDE